MSEATYQVKSSGNKTHTQTNTNKNNSISVQTKEENDSTLTSSSPEYQGMRPGVIMANIQRSLDSGNYPIPPTPIEPKIQMVAPPIQSLKFTPSIQPKLSIGAPGDQYEQEADRVASQVVQRINSSETPPTNNDEDNNTIQTKPQISMIQRVEAPEEELQMKGQTKAGKINIQADFETNLNSARSGGSPLDQAFRAKIEPEMGADFSSVRVHTDSTANDLSQSIQAKAFTTGNDIFFKQGTYDPNSRGGQELLAHELTHVVQQNGSTVQRKPDLIQRDTTQTETDADFKYTNDDIESQMNQKVVLKKPKILYRDKGSNPYKDEKNKDLVVPKGSLVKLLKAPALGWSGSYAQIEFKGQEGWVNTKNAINRDTIVGHDSAGIIMPNGVPTVEDVKQGMFGDCFLLAALMSLVQNRPDYIKNGLFQTDPTQPAEQHTVRFFRVTNNEAGRPANELTFAPENVTVNNTILKLKTTIERSSETLEAGTPVGSRGVQPWPAIVEKAFAKAPNLGYYGSKDLTGGHGYQASMILTGQGYKSLGMSAGDRREQRQMVEQHLATNEEEAAQKILARNRVATKQAIIDSFSDHAQSQKLKTAETKEKPPDEWLTRNADAGVGGSGEKMVGGIAFSHEYSIVHADETEIHLRNPWGNYARVRGEVKPDEAVSILTWDEFFEVLDQVGLGG